MPAGRPLKFKSVKELQDKIDAYFADCDPHIVEEEYIKDRYSDRELVDQEVLTKKVITKQKPYTITGLALALDTTRETLLDYQEKDEYSDTIKRAKNRIHNYAELKLFDSNVAGAIFNLKNNYGWKDQTQVDQHITLPKPIYGGKSVDATDD